MSRLVIIAWFLVSKKLALKGMSNGNNTVTYRNFKNFDRESFRNDISSQSWESVYAFCDPNEMWQEWKHTFLAITNKHARPLKTKGLHQE